MQYSIATAFTTILFASTLTSAAVIPKASQSISIQMKTGDGDASIQETIAVGSLQTKQASGALLGSVVNAFIVDHGFTCQAFSDAKGSKKLGVTFDTATTATTASFTDSSDGEVDSQASSAVALGSICCATSNAFASACGKFGVSIASSSSSSSSHVFPVTIQIDGLSELATQGDILSDGKPHALTAPLEGQGAISASIVHTHKAVNCQAFGDVKGTQKLSAPFAVGKDASFTSKKAQSVNIKAVACALA